MKSMRSLCLLALVICLPLATSSHAQQTTFSVTVTMGDAIGDRIFSDQLGPYMDRSDPGGRTPNIYSGAGGDIEMDLRGSSRKICLNFAGGAALNLTPEPGCFSALIRTKGTPTGGVTSLTPPDSGEFSLVIHWTGRGLDGETRDYNVEFKRVANNGIRATATATGWDIEPVSPSDDAIVSAYLKGKTGGWTEVGIYSMPMTATASKQVPNLRTKGK